MTDENSIDLFERFRDGDDGAADAIFSMYVDRLTSLVRARLSTKLARKVDPEDVVQSAYRSFFRGAADGKFELAQSGRLWSLLAKIALRKVYRQVERFGTMKNDVDLERSLPQLEGIPIEHIAEQPSPDELVAITEEMQLVMSALTTRQRQMLEMHLQGHGNLDIAAEVGVNEKTVRRLLSHVREELEQRLLAPRGDEDPVSVEVYDEQTRLFSATLPETVEVGRQQPGEPGPFCLIRSEDESRLIIAHVRDPKVSRKYVRLESDADKVTVTRLTRKCSVEIGLDGLEDGQSQTMVVPFAVTLGGLTLRLI